MRCLSKERRLLACLHAACVGALLLFVHGSVTATSVRSDDDELIALGTPKSVTLTAPAAGIYIAGTNISFTATAVPSTGTTISRVDYLRANTLNSSQGTTLVGSSSNGLNNYPYTWVSVPGGQYTLAAKATSSMNVSKTSAPVLIKVCDVPTASVTSPSSGTVFAFDPAHPSNTTVNLAANATSPGGGCNISKVDFYANGSVIGTAAGSSFTFPWHPSAAGTYAITAIATDERSVASPASASINVIVDQIPSVSISSLSPPNVGIYQAPVAISVTATASSAYAIDRVEFYASGQLIGTARTSPYTIVWNPQGRAAPYSVIARAFDTYQISADSAAVSVTVNAPPTVSLSFPKEGQIVAAPGPVYFQVTSGDSDGTVTKLELYCSCQVAPITTINNPPATSQYTWSGVPAGGPYTLTAKAYDDRSGTAVSAPVHITVTATNQPPTVQLKKPANGATFTQGAAINFSAIASDVDGTISKVEFYSGSTLLGQSPASDITNCSPYSTSPCTFTFTWPSPLPAPGTYVVTAKTYDNLNASTVSNAASIIVQANHPPVPTITSPASGTSFNPGVVPTISANATDQDSNLATLTFYVNGQLRQTTNIAGGNANASYSLTTDPPGTYVIVVQATDQGGLTAQSTPIIISILGNSTISPANLNNAVAGSLTGSAGVSNMGAATYSIPLAVPPGTAGMSPTLSLSYKSQGGDGLLGIGWSLDGISKITRCPRDVARDGYRGNVSIDSNDRYCLDGQRLVLVPGTGNGAYGSNGSEYRTEIDTFSKIVAQNWDTTGTAWIGTSYFVVQTKSGQTLYYGFNPSISSTQDSVIRQECCGPESTAETGVAWYLFRIEDRSGNYITIQYYKDVLTGGTQPYDINHRPAAILYTGNPSVGGPYAKVTFDYEVRPDARRSFLAGLRMDNQWRLNSIKTWINADTSPTLVNEYRIAYSQSSQSNRSLVSSIKLCDGGGACLPATTVAWQQRQASDNTFNAPGSGVWAGPTVHSTQLPSSCPIYGALCSPLDILSRVVFGDFDGDGKIDLATSNLNSTWTLYLSTGSGFTAQTWSSIGIPIPASYDTKDVLFGDFNGDGRMDFAIPQFDPNTGNGSWLVCLSTGSAFNCQNWGGIGSTDLSRYIVGDFDGDGRDDIAVSGSYLRTYDSLCKSTGSSFNCVQYEHVTDVIGTDVSDRFGERTMLNMGDFNGDGRQDVAGFFYISGGGTLYVPNHFTLWLANDTGFEAAPQAPDSSDLFDNTFPNGFAYSMTLPYGGGASISGDVNGDGYTDLTAAMGGGPGATLLPGKVCRSTGRRLECSDFPISANQEDYRSIFVGDLDGDGRLDTLHVDTTTNQWRVCQVGWDGTLLANTYACTSWGSAPLSMTQGGQPLGPFYFDFNGDGKRDIAFYDAGTNQWTVNLAGTATPDLVATITDGYGATTQFTYDQLTSSSGVYAKDNNAVYPQRDIRDATFVVRNVKRDNGLGSGTLDSTYSYGGLKTDLHGYGSLGVRVMDVVDAVSQTTTHTEFNQNFPFIGMMTLQTVTHTPSPTVVIKQVTNTLASQQGSASTSTFPFVQQSVQTITDLDGTAIATTTTNNSYDSYGNPNISCLPGLPSSKIVAGGETWTTCTVNTYTVDTVNWLVGELIQTVVTKSGPTSSVMRTSTFSYYTNGLLKTETVLPSDTNLSVTTTYTRNNVWGLVDQKTLTWIDPRQGSKSRNVETVTAFESKGRYAATVANALGQTQQYALDLRFGTRSSQTDVSGLTTTWSYDNFGRKITENRPDGTSTKWAYRTYSGCGPNGGCPSPVASVLITQLYSGNLQVVPPTVSYRDRLGRELLAQGYGFDGTEIRTDTQYDLNARVSKTARAYYCPTSAACTNARIWTTLLYDDLGRVKQKTAPDDNNVARTEQTAYAGLLTTVTDVNGNIRKETRNGIGKLKTLLDGANDPLNRSVAYEYDAFGNLTKTTDAGNNAIIVSYDTLGRKTALNDPDLGSWSYGVDPLGQTWNQVDAKNQRTDFYYDDLGRLTQRSEVDVIATWGYDSCRLGLLCAASTTNGYTRAQTYDTLSRPAVTTTTIGPRTYTTTNSYDGFGRLEGSIHQAAGARAVGIGRGYNANGFPYQVASNLAVNWTAQSQDALGRVATELLANGITTTRTFNQYTARLSGISAGASASVESDSYVYDSLGNVKQRNQLNATGGTVVETFTYDSLNRLSTSTVSGQVTKTYGYDSTGNITSKPGPGTLTYNATCGAHSCPHAVSNASGIGGFSYDDNGNMLSGDSIAVQWTSGNQPYAITRAGLNDSFSYGPERQRFLHTQTPGAGRTTRYAGAIEEDVISGSPTTVRTYLPSGIGVIIDDGTNWSTRYFHKDSLGSTIAITNESGAVVERMAYDAWGKRRNLDGTDDTNNAISGQQDRYGFTAQEELDQVRLVHMNGRVYHPYLGRFVSADPYVNDWYLTQGINRYTYVLNDPLGLTDPTGYAVKTEGPTPAEDSYPLPPELQQAIDDAKAKARQANGCDLACKQRINSISPDAAIGLAIGIATQNPGLINAGLQAMETGKPLGVFLTPVDQESFVSFMWDRTWTLHGGVASDIGNFVVGVGAAPGSWVGGLENAGRFMGRAAGLYGEDEQKRWQIEGKAMDELANLIATNPELRRAVGARVVDTVMNLSSREIGTLAGRFFISAALSPIGAAALVGDGTRSVELYGHRIEDIVRGILLGH